jgi:hypothetical protein
MAIALTGLIAQKQNCERAFHKPIPLVIAGFYPSSDCAGKSEKEKQLAE